MADAPRLGIVAALVVAFACWWGPRVALASGKQWSVPSGSYSLSESTGPRQYSYQNINGVQSYQIDTPGGHATGTYRPAGTPGAGNYVFDNSGTGATARTGASFPYAPGKNGAAQISTPIPKAAIAAAAAILAKKVGPVALVTTAAAIYDALSDDGYGDDGSGGWGMSQPAAGPSVGSSVGGYYSSKMEAFWAIYNSLPSGVSWSDMDDSGSKLSCAVWSTPTYYGPNIQCYTAADAAAIAASPGARTYVGPRNAFYTTGTYPGGGSCPEGMVYSSTSPAGCWTDGSNRPATPEELAAMEAAIVDGCPGGCGFGPMIPPILEGGGTIQGPFGPSVITIPDSGPGGGYTSDSQTTTRPDGTQQVTENSYSPSASGDTLEISRTTTVTEKDALGNVTSVTTTVGNATPEAPPAENPPSLCEEFPEVLACIDVGEAPAAESMPTDSVEVDAITPVSVSGVETCPAPIPINLGSHGSYSLSWQPACDVATGVRPVLIALAWLAGAMIVFGVRGGVPD